MGFCGGLDRRFRRLRSEAEDFGDGDSAVSSEALDDDDEDEDEGDGDC